MSWAQHLRRELGATPIGGEVLQEFRYLLLYVGSVDEGARIELLEPVDTGFLTRYLAKRGEGPHHVTFTVPDLRATVAQVRSLDAAVVGESYAHPPWQEAFIPPDSTHGMVIQLAQSDGAYPSADELLATRTLDTASFPSVSGATEPLWWSALWETTPEATAKLGTTHLASTDLMFSRNLFEGVLGGTLHTGEDALDFSWPSGSVRVHARDSPGVLGMSMRDCRTANMRIGPAQLGLPD